MLSESLVHLSPLFIILICSILFAFLIEYLRKYIQTRREQKRMEVIFQVARQPLAYESLFV